MLSLKKIYTILFFLGIFFIPFNEFEGFSFLGEYKNEAATYFFLGAFLLVITENILEKKLYFPYKNKLIFVLICFLIWTAICTIVNYETVLHNFYKQTSGVSRYIRQTISMAMTLVVFTYTFWNVIKNYNYREIVLKVRKVLLYSLFFVFIYGCIEILIVFFGQGFLLPILKLFDFFPFVNTEISVNRMGISSVTFEMPALANYLVTITGFMLSYIVTSKKITRFVPILMILILMVFSDSRTALIIVTFQVFIFIVMLYLHEEYREKTKAFVKIASILVLILFAVNSKTIVTKTSERLDGLNFSKNLTTNISNKSRFGMQYAALEVFKDNPIFGTGLGQGTYHMLKYYPYWATTKNYEFEIWYKNQKIKSFPPLFNMYTRLLAEVGIVGFSLFCFLVLLPILYSLSLWKKADDKDKFIGVILFLSFIGFAINWLQIDFFRQYGFPLCLMILIQVINTYSQRKYVI